MSFSDRKIFKLYRTCSTNEFKVAFKLTEDQIKQTFNLFDKDKDGEITVKEIGAVLRKLKQNPSDEDIEKMIGELDHDKNGFITIDEFQQAISKKVEVLTKDEIRKAFK